MLYLITYSIGKNRDYRPLYEAIKNCGTWWHYIDTTWIVKTEENANAIAKKLNPLIDPVTDSLLVIKLDSSDRQGLLPKKAWEWIRNRSE